ncbi:MAG: (2Fe-2S) ferredoxin domain-containing protein [Christensenellales bacterium]|jgi:NADH:ubiquinone oxidoreductase subunit E
MELVICVGSSCHLKGSAKVVERLQSLIDNKNLQEKVNLRGSFCMGNCVGGVSVTLDGQLFSLSPEDATTFFDAEIMPRL